MRSATAGRPIAGPSDLMCYKRMPEPTSSADMANHTDRFKTLTRIADALDRLAPPPVGTPCLDGADAFVFSAEKGRLTPVETVAHQPLALLKGVDRQRDVLMANTRQFLAGLPANNALLWGARGMGKSSLVKSIHAALNAEAEGDRLVLVELHRDDIAALPDLLDGLRHQPRRVVVFCDDLSFARPDREYKALKSILEGGLAGRPPNVLFYATSNRRHMLPRSMIENEQATALAPGEAVEESVSLSDRFGLWLGFHACDEARFLAIVDGYAHAFALPIETAPLHDAARDWARTRGARSGRVAWQFVQDLAGRLGVSLDGGGAA